MEGGTNLQMLLADAPVAPADSDSDLSASSTSMARMKLESEREEKRQLHSASFFQRRKQEREAQRLQRLKDLQRETVETPAHFFRPIGLQK